MLVEAYNQTIVAPALLMTEPAPFPEDPFPLLLHGTIEGIELIPWGSNYTFAALLRGGRRLVLLRRVQAATWRGAAARFSERHAVQARGRGVSLRAALGWDMIPPTVVREEGPHGVGVAAAVRRAATGRRRAVRPLARLASVRAAAHGALRLADEQRRSQGGALLAGRARPPVGHRSRADVPPRAEAAHGDLGLCRRGDPG